MIVVPVPGPAPTSLSPPVPGYSGHSCSDTYITCASAQNMSWVPFPWCASQSTISTRDPRSRSAAAATATLLTRQKPIDRAGSAWCPGGRTAQNAAVPSPRSSASIASSPAPAARSAAVHESLETAVSGSIWPPPRSQNTSRAVEIFGGVDPFEVLASRQPGREGTLRLGDAAHLETLEHRTEARRPLGMAATGIVLLIPGIRGDHEHRATLPSLIGSPAPRRITPQ